MSQLSKSSVIKEKWIDGLYAGILFIMKLIYAFQYSRTGYQNPLTKKTTALGYAMQMKEILLPNIHRWLQQRENTELFPAVIQVQTINRCNGRCIMCPYPETVHLEDKGIMTDDLYTRIVDEAVQETSLKVFVPMAQTEPLMDVKLVERVREFNEKRRHHQRIEITTNGSLLTKTKMEALIRNGLDLINISLNAMNRETYHAIMKGLDWDTVIRNLEQIAQLDLSRTNVFVRFVRQNENYQEYDFFKTYWRKKGFNTLGIDVNNRADSLKKYHVVQQPVQNRLKRFAKKHFAKRIFPVCPYAFSHLHILHNGDVPFCVNDFTHTNIMGNVKQQRIRDIYNSNEWNRFRRLMVEGKYNEIETCKNCTLWQNANWL
ncbi:MAG: radical SAM protein [Bacillaceae bacterium]|nr:radical SAM protein [Bacillaceae bacterium]